MTRINFKTIRALARSLGTGASLWAIVTSGMLAAAVAIPQAGAAPSKASSAGAKSSVADSAGKGESIDINTASVEALIDLPGIGRSTAQRIVDFRKEHGPFKTVDELLNVRGIGEKSLARFRDRVTVGACGKS